MRSLALSPYCFTSRSRNTRKATAGSVVPPDLEITLMDQLRPSSLRITFSSSLGLREQPTKQISGPLEGNTSRAARAPR